MAQALGARPWGSEDIDASCNIWRKDFELRSLQFKDVKVRTLDGSTEGKENPPMIYVPAGPEENGTSTTAEGAANETSDEAVTLPATPVTDMTPGSMDNATNDTNATNATNATALPDMEGKMELPSVTLATSATSTATYVSAGLVLASLAAAAAFMLKRVQSRPISQTRSFVEDGLE